MDKILNYSGDAVPLPSNYNTSNHSNPYPHIAHDYSNEIQTYTEELLNTITHATGLALSIPGVILLVLLAKRHGGWYHAFACLLYGLTVILMYTCSTLYHYSGITNFEVGTVKFLRTFDHCAIYFLIAGTYTPVTLVNLIYNNLFSTSHFKAGKHHHLEPDKRVAILGTIVMIIVWSMCAAGVSVKLNADGGVENVPAFFKWGFYLAMGWMVVLCCKPYLKRIPKTGLKLLLAGGIAYTTGISFLISDSVPFNHPVWHLFVTCGTSLHYFSVIACVIPIGEYSSWRVMEDRYKSKILNGFTRFAAANLMG
eukprot:TRINITY_DN5489_c0_g1_i1.p1 TRINITY_DN5489_c0_g1~~TRINITY_DN5489_c0_g1_i1.p1  ORF type:complete len:310 (+),score=48.09 TRINITY_DN5489_c0_g1_i1:157-1086(+)